jgi:hypothetical protein
VRPSQIAAASGGTMMIARIHGSARHGKKKSRSFQKR